MVDVDVFGYQVAEPTSGSLLVYIPPSSTMAENPKCLTVKTLNFARSRIGFRMVFVNLLF